MMVVGTVAHYSCAFICEEGVFSVALMLLVIHLSGVLESVFAVEVGTLIPSGSRSCRLGEGLYL
jgi:hypothetical protein